MKSFFIFFVLTAIIFLSLAPPASAAILNIWRGTGQNAVNPNGPTCNKPVTDSTGKVTNPNFCTFCDGLVVASNIIQYLWEIATAITVAMIIYGALRLMVAGGSEEQVKTARGIITNAVIGLIIALAAWAIINTILHVLAGNLRFPWNQIQCQTQTIPNALAPTSPSTTCPPPNCVSCHFPAGCPQSSSTTP